LERPRKFLSSKSIERRKRQQLPLDSTDLPVPETIIKQFKIKGTKVLGTSRWNNTILVSAGDSTLLSTLAKLPCVKEARMVFCSPDSIDTPVSHQRAHFHMHYNRWDSLRGDPLGMARTQIEMLGGENLHERNLRGKGMTIAVLDGGFQNVDRLLCFARTSIEGTHDFVGINKKELSDDEEEEQFYCGIDHGTRVFSAMAAQADQVITGTAPEADYWLLKCEDPETEMPIEEDYWAMAAEFADSAGVDIINSSLGYNDYDAPFKNYQLNDLDGKTSLISRTASMLAHKGIVLCNSAGNSGMGTWKKITVPADADHILTVGAMLADEPHKIAPFSSVGPTQDQRVKPDVVAIGAPAKIVNGRGVIMDDMGTSFSAPIVCGLAACLWQALRKCTAEEVIDLIRQCSSNSEHPDNIYGFGVPNFWRAYMVGKMKSEE